jgi:hypothetical protein
MFFDFKIKKHKLNLKLLFTIVLTNFLIIEPLRVYAYENALFPIIDKFSPFVFNTVASDLEYQSVIMSYLQGY